VAGVLDPQQHTINVPVEGELACEAEQAGVEDGPAGWNIRGGPPGVDHEFPVEEQQVSDLESNHGSSYQSASDVSTGIESFNNEIPDDEEYVQGDADSEDSYHPSNAAIGRLVNELEVGLQQDQPPNPNNNTIQRRQGLRPNRQRSYSHRFGYTNVMVEEPKELYRTMLLHFERYSGYSRAFEHIKAMEFHYTNFLATEIPEITETKKIDEIVPRVTTG